MAIPRLNRLLAGLLATSLFLTQGMCAYGVETDFWAERQKSLATQHRSKTALALAPLSNKTPLINLVRSATPLTENLSFPPSGLAKILPPDFEFLREISPRFGSIRHVTLGRGEKPWTVLHIQDVHQNPDAQKNIGAVVEALVSQGVVDLIALEGTWGAVDVSGFRKFPHQDAVRKVADYLLKENKISGAVYQALTLPGDMPPLVGIDDATLHAANVNAYLESRPLLADRRAWLNNERASLAADKERVLNPQLKMLDHQLTAYREGNRSLGDFVLYLGQRVSLKESPAIQHFAEVVKLEKRINFSQVEEDRKALLALLTPQLSPAESDTLLQRGVAFQLGQLSWGDFYRHLKTICQAKGVSLHRFPAMNDYLRYVLQAEDINPEALFTEVEAVQRAALEKVIATPEERALVQASERLHLTGKLLDFSLTPQEWQDYKKLRNPTLLPNFSTFEAFYHHASQRDQAMAQNLQRAWAALPSSKPNVFPSFLEEGGPLGSPIPLTTDLSPATSRARQKTEKKPHLALLITGGFHSQGLDPLLAQSGATVITFSPKIEKVDSPSGEKYLSVFAQEKTPLDILFQGQKLFLAPNPAAGLGVGAFMTIALEAFRGETSREKINHLLQEFWPKLGQEFEMSIERSSPNGNTVALTAQPKNSPNKTAPVLHIETDQEGQLKIDENPPIETSARWERLANASVWFLLYAPRKVFRFLFPAIELPLFGNLAPTTLALGEPNLVNDERGPLLVQMAPILAADISADEKVRWEDLIKILATMKVQSSWNVPGNNALSSLLMDKLSHQHSLNPRTLQEAYKLYFGTQTLPRRNNNPKSLIAHVLLDFELSRRGLKTDLALALRESKKAPGYWDLFQLLNALSGKDESIEELWYGFNVWVKNEPFNQRYWEGVFSIFMTLLRDKSAFDTLELEPEAREIARPYMATGDTQTSVEKETLIGERAKELSLLVSRNLERVFHRQLNVSLLESLTSKELNAINFVARLKDASEENHLLRRALGSYFQVRLTGGAKEDAATAFARELLLDEKIRTLSKSLGFYGDKGGVHPRGPENVVGRAFINHLAEKEKSLWGHWADAMRSIGEMKERVGESDLRKELDMFLKKHPTKGAHEQGMRSAVVDWESEAISVFIPAQGIIQDISQVVRRHLQKVRELLDTEGDSWRSGVHPPYKDVGVAVEMDPIEILHLGWPGLGGSCLDLMTGPLWNLAMGSVLNPHVAVVYIRDMNRPGNPLARVSVGVDPLTKSLVLLSPIKTSGAYSFDPVVGEFMRRWANRDGLTIIASEKLGYDHSLGEHFVHGTRVTQIEIGYPFYSDLTSTRHHHWQSSVRGMVYEPQSSQSLTARTQTIVEPKSVSSQTDHRQIARGDNNRLESSWVAGAVLLGLILGVPWAGLGVAVLWLLVKGNPGLAWGRLGSRFKGGTLGAVIRSVRNGETFGRILDQLKRKKQDDLPLILRNSYGIGKIKAIQPLAGSLFQPRVFQVNSTTGKYIFRRTSRLMAKGDFSVHYQDFLFRQGFPVPEIVRRIDAPLKIKFGDHADVVNFQGERFYLERQLDNGQEIDLEAETPAHYQAIGRLAGKLNSVSQEFHPPKDFVFQPRNRLGLQLLEKINHLKKRLRTLPSTRAPPADDRPLLSHLLEQREPIFSQLEHQLNSFLKNYSLQNQSNFPDQGKGSYVHNDLHFGNLRFGTGQDGRPEVVSFYDMEMAQKDWRGAEFNNAFFAPLFFSNNRHFNPQFISALIQGFNETAKVPLTEAEQKAVWELVRFRFIEVAVKLAERELKGLPQETQNPLPLFKFVCDTLKTHFSTESSDTALRAREDAQRFTTLTRQGLAPLIERLSSSGNLGVANLGDPERGASPVLDPTTLWLKGVAEAMTDPIYREAFRQEYGREYGEGNLGSGVALLAGLGVSKDEILRVGAGKQDGGAPFHLVHTHFLGQGEDVETMVRAVTAFNDGTSKNQMTAILVAPNEKVLEGLKAAPLWPHVVLLSKPYHTTGSDRENLVTEYNDIVSRITGRRVHVVTHAPNAQVSQDQFLSWTPEFREALARSLPLTLKEVATRLQSLLAIARSA